MKKSLLSIFLAFSLGAFAKDYPISSPDGRIQVTVSVGNEIKWSSTISGQPVFAGNQISLDLGTEVLGNQPKVITAKTTHVSQKVTTVVPVKSRMIDDTYTQLNLKFKQDYSVTFRVFNNGVAYRFETTKKGKVTVKNEQVDLNFAGDFSVLFPEEETLYSHYERTYLDEKISSLDAGRFCSLPTLVKADKNVKIGITEADLFDYPCLFLEATGKATFKSKYSPVILKSEPRGDRDIHVTQEADYIAVTDGTRTYPWRVFMMSENDAQLVENQMVFLLSRESKIEDTSWIKPGLVAWDWWNANNIYGVDFKSGINTQTYKYYIDFASKYGIPYIILDEGWSKSTTNVMEPNPDINMEELVAYGKSKNVDLILWSLWGPIDKDMDKILDQFVKWGVKGLKVDFMAQANQYMVNFYERTAKACADRHLLVDYHGAFKPAGLRRAYPNVINYEGVKGLENCKWSALITPEHDVTLCFTRMLAGPMDYTPGAMHNANKIDYSSSFLNPMSMGTRCHQMALYVVFDAPLQMLADNPSNYYREPECTEFISKMKTTWDETKVIDAKVADYIVTARRSNQDWYIGAITDFDARSIDIDLSFLGEGEYEMEIMQDGINADKAAVDYKKIVKKVNRLTKITIPMAAGGGWAAICKKI